MNIAGAPVGVEVIGQFPGPDQEQNDRFEKLRVPVEEGISRVNQDPKEGTAIIDGVLSALRTELAGQGSAAILAMSQRSLGQLRSAPATKDPASSRWLFGGCRNGIGEDKLLGFVSHLRLILSQPKHDGHRHDLPRPGEIRRYELDLHRL